ncbi:interleukin-37 isoform X2 [Pteropus medius]|uniref:interleukin-37 isoform X2 n=1 Tax=Pteropus vampyrus TaxID=132908 RepID=UPI00196A82F6|nr:interleukin-37 isoform X2 [Pteropus giganteus]
MSFLEESPAVRTGSEGWEGAELQGSSGETFFVLASHLSSACENGSPILLAVADGELCLCCEQDKSADQPSLQLKKRKLRHLAIQHEADQQPFTFYRAVVGSWNTLESAMHPGWFISTSCNPGEPVRMTNQPGIKNTIEFSFEQVCEAKTGPAKSAGGEASPPVME